MLNTGLNSCIKVSVIIPFFSNIEWLDEAVKSVLSQTYGNVEIIVINDGSVEDDKEFLKMYEGKVVYIKTRNSGPGTARNIGIDLAGGEFVAFLDSDDLWHPEKLCLQLSEMLKNNWVWSHTSYSLFTGDSNNSSSLVDVTDFAGDVFLRCLLSSPIATPCVMVKRDLLVNNKDLRFSETMRYGQDGFFWLNLARHNRVGVVSSVLTFVRMRGNNAALRARVHLQVKSQIHDFIKQQSLTDEKYKSLPLSIKYAYALCKHGQTFIKILDSRFALGSITKEYFCRLIYIFPYLLLKFSSRNKI